MLSSQHDLRNQNRVTWLCSSIRITRPIRLRTRSTRFVKRHRDNSTWRSARWSQQKPKQITTSSERTLDTPSRFPSWSTVCREYKHAKNTQLSQETENKVSMSWSCSLICKKSYLFIKTTNNNNNNIVKIRFRGASLSYGSLLASGIDDVVEYPFVKSDSTRKFPGDLISKFDEVMSSTTPGQVCKIPGIV